MPKGYKTYSKGKPIRIEEFDLEKEWWDNRFSEKYREFSWLVKIDEIRKRDFNLDVKNPFRATTNHSVSEISSKYAQTHEQLQYYTCQCM
jgi:type I restriction enzyme M protein